MAKCNSTKNNRNGLKVFAIIVSILLVVCFVASLCVIGRTTNGFKEIPDFDDEEVEEDPFVVVPEDDDEANNSGDSVGVSLYAEKIPEEDYGIMGLASSTVGAYNVIASYEPSNADIKDFSWSLALDTSWKGYKSSGDYTDYYGTVWSSSSSFKMSDYITLSGDDTLSCTVTCNQVFGCPVILTFIITDVLDRSFSASCNLNCKTYNSGFYFSAYSSDSCSVDVDIHIENTDPVSDGPYVDVVNSSFVYTSDRKSYNFSSRLLSISDNVIDYSGSLSLDPRLVSVGYRLNLSSVSYAGITRSYISSVDLCCFGNSFVSDIRDSGRVQTLYSSEFDDYFFEDLVCYFCCDSDDVYTVGTLSCDESLSEALNKAGVSYSVKSGVDGSILFSDSFLSLESCFSVDSCLSHIIDENGVSLTRENLCSGTVSSVFMQQFCDSSHPILNIEFSCGVSTSSIPLYFSDVSYFRVGLSGAFVGTSDLVFN